MHSTYGQRHRYLVRPDVDGAAHIAKEFYVSPFNPVRGEYRMRLPEPDEHLRVSITRTDDRPIFAASMTGRCHPATVRTILRATVAIPLAPLLVSMRIRRHGVRLWARGLPLVPRPAEHLEEHSR